MQGDGSALAPCVLMDEWGWCVRVAVAGLRTAGGGRDTQIGRRLVSFIVTSHWCCLETVFTCPFTTEMSSSGPGFQGYSKDLLGSGDITVNWYGRAARRGSLFYLFSPHAPTPGLVGFNLGRLCAHTVAVSVWHRPGEFPMEWQQVNNGSSEVPGALCSGAHPPLPVKFTRLHVSRAWPYILLDRVAGTSEEH